MELFSAQNGHHGNRSPNHLYGDPVLATVTVGALWASWGGFGERERAMSQMFPSDTGWGYGLASSPGSVCGRPQTGQSEDRKTAEIDPGTRSTHSVLLTRAPVGDEPFTQRRYCPKGRAPCTKCPGILGLPAPGCSGAVLPAAVTETSARHPRPKRHIRRGGGGALL